MERFTETIKPKRSRCQTKMVVSGVSILSTILNFGNNDRVE
jgi:hypothetical protein